jgi:hypothetical protein
MTREQKTKHLETEQTYPGVCRGCRAEIVWLRQRNNRMHPYNPDGTSHFATCPKADEFRTNKQARLF